MAVAGDGLEPDPLAGLLNDPEIQALMAGAMGPDPSQMSLPEALAATSYSMVGRRGITGQDFTGPLPPWAKSLAPEILSHPDFDPYFGVVSEPGDERVFMGVKDVEARGPVDTGAPLAAGMVRTETSSESSGTSDLRDLLLDPTGKNPKPAATTPGDGVEFRSGGQRPADEAQTPGEPEATEGRKARKRDRTLTVQQAMNLPYTWDEEEIVENMRRMREAGVNVTSFDQLVEAWGGLVNRASMIYAMSEGDRKVTPWDALDMYKAEAKAAGSFTNYEHGRQVTVARQVNEVSEGEAWNALQQTLSQMLGRDPSDDELRKFTYRMNSMAAANPAISRTVEKYRNGEATSTTHVDPGFTAADMAQSAYERAQNDPEYAEYQAATTYFNAAMSALGAIGGA